MNTFYPVALAEKISRRELNDATEADIVASFNSNAPWYYKTDGMTPPGKMDLVTIVLHEIAHGLGFTDSFEVKDMQGSAGLPQGELSVPFIFDLYIENDSSKNMVYDFQSPSSELANAIQSGNVFFNSPGSVMALSGMRPELFAPPKFEGGSSISHLDENAFNGDGDPNRLMTPHISPGESIHDLGSVLRGILSDLGWVYTYIDHVRLRDTERKDGQPYPVRAFIASDNGYDATEVKLHYSTDGKNFTAVNMTPTGTADEFAAALPGTTVDQAYAYFISVVDATGRTFTNPGTVEEIGKRPEQGTYVFSIGVDVTPPRVSHEPVEYISEEDNELELTAEVTDNAGVKEVLVEYTVNDGSLETAVMTRVGNTDEYEKTLTLPGLVKGDQIKYRLVARDVATNENVSRLPDEAFYSVTVTGTGPVQDSYSNNFNIPSSDFLGNNFHIITPEGFQNGAIHSDHPYVDGSGANQESSYAFYLQIPIRVAAINALIKFDEVVLVEPGEEGSEFGEGNFFDYVTVEGSTDGGKSWRPFVDGYDSRDNSPWLAQYNSDIVNFNSRAQGNAALFRPRVINMVENGNFSEGDEVLIRFRLFADALAHGWGWAIDNLSIQGPVTDIEKGLLTTFKVYPVPVQKDLFMELLNPEALSVDIQISDLQGRIHLEKTLTDMSGDIGKRIDVSFLHDGLYILKATVADKIYTRRFLKLAE